MKFFCHIVENNFALIEHGNGIGNIEDIVDNMSYNDSTKVVIMAQGADEREDLF